MAGAVPAALDCRAAGPLAMTGAGVRFVVARHSRENGNPARHVHGAEGFARAGLPALDSRLRGNDVVGVVKKR